MNSVYIGNITLSLFGESHGKGVGLIIDGFPPGFKVNIDEVRKEMNRRKPGKSILETQRKENDEFEILSGFFEKKTTGSPICVLIRSKDMKKKDYSDLKNKMRPGHSDYTGSIRYRGFNDYRGGGHFSGRLTAPIVFAGSICKQFLLEKNIIISSHIKQLYNIKDRCFLKKDFNKKTFERLKKERIPVLKESLSNLMEKNIKEALINKDSVGGIIECAAIGLKAGLGNPFFNSLESQISHLVFSIPSIKGIMFGSGIKIASMKGSESNDCFFVNNKKQIETKTNHNGGILGGISTGMPVVFQCIIKSTPSIKKCQKTFDKSTLKNILINLEGRHDPCIIPRAIPVVESMLSLAILNVILEDLKWN